jgi:hypothetical protein
MKLHQQSDDVDASFDSIDWLFLFAFESLSSLFSTWLISVGNSLVPTSFDIEEVEDGMGDGDDEFVFDCDVCMRSTLFVLICTRFVVLVFGVDSRLLLPFISEYDVYDDDSACCCWGFVPAAADEDDIEDESKRK